VPLGLAVLVTGATMDALRMPTALWVAGAGFALASIGAVWEAKPPRAVVGFAIAPASPGLIQLALTGEPFAWFIVFGAYPFALGLGVPAYLLMRRFGYLGLMGVTLVGFALGCGVGAIVLARGSAPELLRFGGYGALTSLIFWFIAFAGSGSSLGFRGWNPSHEA